MFSGRFLSLFSTIQTFTFVDGTVLAEVFGEHFFDTPIVVSPASTMEATILYKPLTENVEVVR